MADYPLVVLVSVGKDDILARWRSDAAVAIAVAAILSVILGILGWRLARQFRLHDKVVAAVRLQEEQYRLLADYSMDVIIQFDADGRRKYVSPAVERMLGYQPAELLGGHPRETVHPEDWPQVAASAETVRATGYAPAVAYRVRRKDGLYIWVETQGRKLDGKAGTIVTIRDITSRKRIEVLLQQAHAGTVQLLVKDSLTGLINRRGFDETLEKECRRAARHGTPVALLMIDVNRLRDFNDRYGYSAGDECLVAVANAIRSQAHRPADIVARSGRGEFAVLLPDTDPAGATAKVEQVRAAVRALDIPHAGSSAGTVTVNVGVGVVYPQPGEKNEQTLIQMADAALARAKAELPSSIEKARPFPE